MLATRMAPEQENDWGGDIMKKLADEISSIINLGVKRFGTQKKLAEAAGIPDANVSRWLRGTRRSPSISDFSPLMFAAGVDLHFPDEEMMAFAIIPKYAAKAGAGSSWETSGETEGFYAFRRDWLHANNISAAKARLIEVRGDSMEPTLREGDTLLVDENDTALMEGLIYVVTLGDELLVKRILKDLDGIWLKSDNPHYDKTLIDGDKIRRLSVRGRVRWVGKEL